MDDYESSSNYPWYNNLNELFTRYNMAADISQRIKNVYPSFSKGQKKIANAILNEYDKAAYLTAAKLGKLVGVSESTVVRFANELGRRVYNIYGQK